MTVGWHDLEGLVDVLRDAQPRVDPRALQDKEVQGLVEGLPDFESGGSPPGPGDFEALRAMWHWGV